MLATVRNRVSDPYFTRWSDVFIRENLNHEARRIQNAINPKMFANYARKESSSITLTGAASYAVSGITGFTDFDYLKLSNPAVARPKYILEKEFDDYLAIYPSGIDSQDRVLFTLTFDESTFVWTLLPVVASNFPSGTAIVVYFSQPSWLATNGSADASTYNTIPEQYQEAIIESAVARMLLEDGQIALSQQSLQNVAMIMAGAGAIAPSAPPPGGQPAMGGPK